MIDKYKKGRRVYTHWDKKSEQVTIVPKKNKELPDGNKSIKIEVPSFLVSGKRVNFFVIHSNRNEFIVDFGVQSVPMNKGDAAEQNTTNVKIVSRVIMSPRQAKKFLLKLEKQL
ncbi:MAG: DUF3467 domain-containing protein [Endomicrobiales bacterium]|nr:DUF3467 domain-containing protein [Endomicrobiales bacterium]